MDFDYPEFIKKLPLADIPFEGVRGYLLPSPLGLVVFFDIDPIGKIPEHSHGEQWGVVLSGSMDLTTNGATRTVIAGDKYHIPPGIRHSAVFHTKFFAVDFFAEPDRYRIKE